LTAEAARLVVPNLLLGNTILLTNTRSYPQQAQRIGEIIDAGELPPGSRGERMPPLLDPSWVSEARR
jgi:acyl-CoA reductase-like NAD-dependent aldehyde dehydrogenase